MKILQRFTLTAPFVVAACIGLPGCEVQNASTGSGRGGAISKGSASGGQLSGEISIDGSSTVQPISKAMAVQFGGMHPDVRISVAAQGTGGGFGRFELNETDINDASRPIKEKEIAKCLDNGVEYVELRVAVDGLSVVVNKANDWCNAMTVAQLKKLWEPGSQVTKWKQLDPSWPDHEISLFAPDTDSGTFDYFTEEIVGESKASRTDYEPNTNDNVLVTGVSGNKYALGYFGYAYYVENKDVLKAVAISDTENAADGVLPTEETVLSGAYKPLSRPLFLYVNKQKLTQPHVAEFLRYYLGEGQDVVKEVGYVQLPADMLESSRATLEAALAGSSE